MYNTAINNIQALRGKLDRVDTLQYDLLGIAKYREIHARTYSEWQAAGSPAEQLTDMFEIASITSIGIFDKDSMKQLYIGECEHDQHQFILRLQGKLIEFEHATRAEIDQLEPQLIVHRQQHRAYLAQLEDQLLAIDTESNNTRELSPNDRKVAVILGTAELHIARLMQLKDEGERRLLDLSTHPVAAEFDSITAYTESLDEITAEIDDIHAEFKQVNASLKLLIAVKKDQPTLELNDIAEARFDTVNEHMNLLHSQLGDIQQLLEAHKVQLKDVCDKYDAKINAEIDEFHSIELSAKRESIHARGQATTAHLDHSISLLESIRDWFKNTLKTVFGCFSPRMNRKHDSAAVGINFAADQFEVMPAPAANDAAPALKTTSTHTALNRLSAVADDGLLQTRTPEKASKKVEKQQVKVAYKEECVDTKALKKMIKTLKKTQKHSTDPAEKTQMGSVIDGLKLKLAAKKAAKAETKAELKHYKRAHKAKHSFKKFKAKLPGRKAHKVKADHAAKAATAPTLRAEVTME